MRSFRSVLLLLFALALALTCRDVSAHPELEETIEISTGENGVELVVTTSMTTVMTSIARAPRSGAFYDPPELDAALSEHLAYLAAHLALDLDDRPAPLKVVGAELETRVTAPVARRVELEKLRARIRLAASGPRAPARLRLQSNVLQDVVDPDGQRWAVSYVVFVRHSGAPPTSYALRAGQPLELHLGALAGTREQLITFFVLGLRHIGAGFDHLLFLAALVLGAASWRSLAARILAFTLAHSAALVTGALGWISAPARVVEPLVAGSIIVAALVARPASPSRSPPRPQQTLGPGVLVAAAFGVVHGLAFATGLREAMGGAAQLALALVGFTLGIEVMQQGLVVPVYGAAGWLARSAGRAAWLERARLVVLTLGVMLLIQTLRE